DPNRDRWKSILGTGGVLGVSGLGLLAMAVRWKKKAGDMSPRMIAALTEGESKDKQDNTYSRVRLVKDGVKIVTYEKKAPKKDDLENDGQGFVLVKKTGDILIKAAKDGAGIKAESKAKIEILAPDAEIILKGKGITIDATTGDLTLKGANVQTDATQGYKLSAPQSKENE